MNNLSFTSSAWQEYCYWQVQDKKTLKRINMLLSDIQRNGVDSRVGKVEILKNREGYSKRIDKANRLVYTFNSNGDVVVLSCKGHYQD